MMNAAAINVQKILGPLRRAGWVLKQTEDKDLSVLFVVLVEAFDMHKTPEELCGILPFFEPDHDHDEENEGNRLGLIELLNSMARLGKIGHPVNIDLRKLDPRLYPCLFIPNGKSEDEKDAFVILGKGPVDNTFKIHRKNGLEPEMLTLEKRQKGTLWLFVPEEESLDPLSREYMKASGHSWFRALLERFQSSFGPIFIIGGMLTLLALMAPLFVMTVYDRVIGAHAPEVLVPLLIGAVLALAIEAGLRVMRAQTLSWYGARLDYIVSTYIFARLVKLPVLFTERASISAQVARIKAFNAVRAFFTGPQILALAELPFTILLMAVIALIAGKVVIIPIVAAGLYGLLFISMRPAMRTAMRLSANAASVRQELMIETFEKIDALRAGGLTPVWFHEFRERSGKASVAAFHASWLSAVLETLSQMLYTLAGLAIIAGGVLQIWSGAMSAGALIASMIISWRILAPMQTLCNALPRFVQLQNAITQINRLMDIETEGNKGNITARLNSPKGEITFNKVGLRYTKECDPVFTGLSFNAKPGQMIAVTGVNGAGKSTILKLTNGLYHPQAGSIHIDGIDIRQLEPLHLRSHIAALPQNPSLFHGSIADNLRFANPLADDEHLQEALEQVDLWPYIEKLPMGMLTTISAQGTEQLPAGMAYNIALARAYVQNTPLMLFDELPYSLLNSVAGAIFKDKLKEWKGKKTVLMVTHREDYMELCDQVVLLRTGRPPLVDKPTAIITKIYEQQQGRA